MNRVVATLVMALCCAPLIAADKAGLERRVEVLERRVQALSDLLLRMDSLQREVQQLRGEVELQGHAVEAVKQRQRDLYLDVDKRLGQMSQPGAGEIESQPEVDARPATPVLANAPEIPPPMDSQVVSPPTTVDADQEEHDYQNAFELLTQRRYNEARASFQAFLKRYPSGQYADNAQYWLGEASYVTRDFSTALVDFERVVQRYPSSPKVSGALLKIGYIQFEQKSYTEARQTLDDLMQRYPGSSAARLAQEFIRKKGL